jgi:hypothetical protein
MICITRGKNMKDKNSIVPERRQIAWRRVALRLAAIILLIVFLAGECATLLPID